MPLIMEPPAEIHLIPEVVDRFLSHVSRGEGDPESDNRCWIWLHSTTKEGTPRFCCFGAQVASARVMLEIETGASSAGLRITNHCGNKLCVRPSHQTTSRGGPGRAPKGVFMRKTVAVPGWEPTPVPDRPPGEAVAERDATLPVPASAARLPIPPALDPPREREPREISSVTVGPEWAILHYRDGSITTVHRHAGGEDLYSALAKLAAKERGAA